MTEGSNYTITICREELKKQRSLLLERLAECANEIKRIDGQLKAI